MVCSIISNAILCLLVTHTAVVTAGSKVVEIILCSVFIFFLTVCAQVRAMALKTLNIAHTVGPRSTTFPVEDMVRMLMFPNAAEATDFIQQYGLNVSDG